MAADKFIFLNNGQLAEKFANQSSVGVGDAGKIVALDSTGRLDASVMPVGVTPEVKLAACSENLSAGDLINLYNDSGLKARKADCSNNRRAHGFVLDAFTDGQTAIVHIEGMNTAVSGKTVGEIQFLSTGGTCSPTPPSTSNYIVQEIGVAVGATEMTFEPQKPITLA